MHCRGAWLRVRLNAWYEKSVVVSKQIGLTICGVRGVDGGPGVVVASTVV